MVIESARYHTLWNSHIGVNIPDHNRWAYKQRRAPASVQHAVTNMHEAWDDTVTLSLMVFLASHSL